MRKNYGKITIGGKGVLLRFGLPSIRYINEIDARLNIRDDKDGGNYSELGFAYLFYGAYLNQIGVNGGPQEYTIEDFIDYVEEQTLTDATEISDALAVYMSSTAVEQLAERVVKKNKQLTAGLSESQETKSPPPGTS